MKRTLKYIFIPFVIFCCHYLFVGILRSNAYTYIMLGLALLAAILAFCTLLDYIVTDNEKDGFIAGICTVYIVITIAFPMTGIGVTDETRLFTIQMTYYDGYTETATYELPEDAEFYLDNRGRYSSGTDLEYRNYPFHGGTIERNIVRYKVISVKDK